MNLRARLVLGYGYLATLVVVGGVVAALGFHGLGTGVGRVLVENVESLRAAMVMLEALERQDSALLAMLLGEPGSRQLLDQSEAAFTEGFERARANVTEAAEPVILADLDARFLRYRAARERLLAEPQERPLAAYQAETLPRFEEVKEAVRQLLEVNQGAMVEADRRAERRADAQAAVHGLLVGVALISFGWLAQALGRDVLGRIAELKAVAAAIAGGDRTRRASVLRRDELGLVAELLNTVLDHHQRLEADVVGRLSQQRQLLAGLLANVPGPAVLLSPDGTQVVATLDPEPARTVADAARQLAATELPPREVRVPLPSGTAVFSPLRVEGGRLVGWLATVEATAKGSGQATDRPAAQT